MFLCKQISVPCADLFGTVEKDLLQIQILISYVALDDPMLRITCTQPDKNIVQLGFMKTYYSIIGVL